MKKIYKESPFDSLQDVLLTNSCVGRCEGFELSVDKVLHQWTKPFVSLLLKIACVMMFEKIRKMPKSSINWFLQTIVYFDYMYIIIISSTRRRDKHNAAQPPGV